MVEVLLSVVIIGVVLLVWWRLSALVQNSRAREALSDYLLGVALQCRFGYYHCLFLF